MSNRVCVNLSVLVYCITCADPEGGQRVRTPLENQENIGFLSNILVWITWKITKLQSQHSISGHYRPVREMPFKRSLVGRWWPAYSGIWILPPLFNRKNPKINVKVGLPLTKLSGSAHVSLTKCITCAMYILLLSQTIMTLNIGTQLLLPWRRIIWATCFLSYTNLTGNVLPSWIFMLLKLHPLWIII